MPFKNGNDRFLVNEGELRFSCENGTGINLQIFPSKGPIGGISVFIGRATIPALLQTIAGCIAYGDAIDAPELAEQPPHMPHPVVDTLREGEAAEIWLRGAAKPATESVHEDVLTPPSLWRR